MLVAQSLDSTVFPPLFQSPTNLTDMEGFLFGGFDSLPLRQMS